MDLNFNDLGGIICPPGRQHSIPNCFQSYAQSCPVLGTSSQSLVINTRFLYLGHYDAHSGYLILQFLAPHTHLSYGVCHVPT